MSIRRHFAVLVPLFAVLVAVGNSSVMGGVVIGNNENGEVDYERFVEVEGTGYSSTASSTEKGLWWPLFPLSGSNLDSPPTAESKAHQTSLIDNKVLYSTAIQVVASFSDVDNEPPRAFATAYSRYYVEFEITGQSVDYTLDWAFQDVNLTLGEDTTGEARSTVVLAAWDGTSYVPVGDPIEVKFDQNGSYSHPDSTPPYQRTGTLSPGDYSFLVESYVMGMTESSSGVLSAYADHQVTLTLPEPATAGLLAVGVLAGLLRRRRRRK